VRRDQKRLECRQAVSDDHCRQLAPLLAILDHVVDHVSDPKLNVDDIARKIPIDSRIRRRFRQETGLGIHEYLVGLKRAMAEWLVAETELPVGVIAEDAFGYSSANNFHRDFKQWKGATPLDFRNAARAAREAEPEPEVSSIGIRWRASVGLLPPEQVRRFAEDLERRFPLADDEIVTPPPALVFRGDVYGEIQAQIVWNRLRDEPPDRRLEILRSECAFESLALLDFLSGKSLEAGRRHRQDGVHWARTALAAVEGSRRFLGERFGEALALARTRLGNALHLAGELEAAHQALAEAREVLLEAERPNPRVLWEVASIEADVYLGQRRFEDALSRLDEAVEHCREPGDACKLAKCLLVRFDVRFHQGLLDKAVADLLAAEELLSELDEPQCSLGVRQDRVAVYARVGDYENAARELSKVRELCENVEHRVLRNQLRWLDGRIRRGLGDLESAEAIWREALAEFKEVGDPSAVADLALELALLCQDQDRLAEGLELVAAETIPALRALGIHRGDRSALDLLQEAAASREVPAAVLQQARDVLRRKSRAQPEGSTYPPILLSG
jgi:AraC-like DNA-binding protein/tetratricopeptide (TPR) repeat protein